MPSHSADSVDVNPVTLILPSRGISQTSAKMERNAGLGGAPAAGGRGEGGDGKPLKLPARRWAGTPQLRGLLPVTAFSTLWANTFRNDLVALCHAAIITQGRSHQTLPSPDQSTVEFPELAELLGQNHICHCLVSWPKARAPGGEPAG